MKLYKILTKISAQSCLNYYSNFNNLNALNNTFFTKLISFTTKIQLIVKVLHRNLTFLIIKKLTSIIESNTFFIRYLNCIYLFFESQKSFLLGGWGLNI